MKAVGEHFQERIQIARRLEHLRILLRRKLRNGQLEQLLHKHWPLQLNARRKEVEQLLCGLGVDVRLRQMQSLGQRHVLHVLGAHQHDAFVHHLEGVGVLGQEVTELFDVLAGYVSDLGRCLTAMAEQAFDGHLGADAVQQQLVLEVVARLLAIVAAAGRGGSVRVAFGVLQEVDLDVVLVDDEECGVLREEFFESYKNAIESARICFYGLLYENIQCECVPD